MFSRTDFKQEERQIFKHLEQSGTEAWGQGWTEDGCLFLIIFCNCFGSEGSRMSYCFRS